MTEHKRVVAALRDEFETWIANAPNAGLFDWNVAADNVLRAIAEDSLVRAAVSAVEAHRRLVEASGGVQEPEDTPEALEALERRLGTNPCGEKTSAADFMPRRCTCGASGGMDGHGYFCALRGPFSDL